MEQALLEGFFASMGLIMAIGAQNAFVISQGVSGKHNFPIAMTSAAADAVLLTLGIFGVGALIQQHEIAHLTIKWAGIVFLSWYGWQALQSAIKTRSMETMAARQMTLVRVLMTALALSFLNPHAYLDMFVLLGGISSKFSDFDKQFFLAGALSASFVWFFSLSFGAKKLAPVFQTTRAWRVLDSLVALMMWGLALSLLMS